VEPLITETKNKLADFQKVNGSHYTPELLAGFVAKQVIEAAKDQFSDSIKILDPAVGDGELLISLLSELTSSTCQKVYVTGFDTNPEAINTGFTRIKNLFPNIAPDLSCDNFIDISQNYDLENNLSPFAPQKFDLVIANPPYVRTQVLGANKARQLANTFELAGRIDLYHVFIRGIAAVLRPGGIAGIIVSNRFMTTKAGL
jgi:adenine-specific DNA-methyltransferase